MLAACAPTQHTPQAPPSPVTDSSPAGFLEGEPGRVRSHVLDFPIELSLPGKASWQINEGPSWLVLSQAASSSQLALRTWRADRLIRRAECEAQARLARPAIPKPREDAIVDRQALAIPAEFDSELLVAVEPSAHGLSGYALVFGASSGRCFAAIFDTRVSGANAEREIAARLGLAVDRVLNTVRILSVDARAPRRRLLVTPKAAGE